NPVRGAVPRTRRPPNLHCGRAGGMGPVAPAERWVPACAGMTAVGVAAMGCSSDVARVVRQAHHEGGGWRAPHCTVTPGRRAVAPSGPRLVRGCRQAELVGILSRLTLPG